MIDIETAKIKTLKDMTTGEPIAPRTHISALNGTGQKGQVVGFTEDNILGLIDSVGGESVPISATLYASNWVSGSQTVTIPGVTRDTNGVSGLAQDITDEQMNAAKGGELYLYSQDVDSISITAFGEIPKVDIPIVVILLP